MKAQKEKFIRWIQSLPEDIKIDFNSNTNCVICQFMRDVEGIEIYAGAISYLIEDISYPIDKEIQHILTKARLHDENNLPHYSYIITKPRLLNAIKHI